MQLSRIRKALAPFILGAAATIGQWIATNDLDVEELRTIAASAFVAIVVYFVPNDDGVSRPDPLAQFGP